MLSVVKTKKNKSLVKFNHFQAREIWPAVAVINHKINHFLTEKTKEKLHYEYMHTVILKLCPNSLDLYFKVLPKYLAATRIAKK